MRYKQLEALDRDLHPRAEELARDYIDNFAVSLLLHAKVIAYHQKADIVLSSHIREARQVLHRRQRQRWLRDLLIVVGSVVFGALVPGLLSTLLGVDQLLLTLAIAVGILGVTLVFIGLRR